MNPTATIHDLYRTPGKAELVGGRIVMMSPTGWRPSRAASNIYLSLREYEKRVGHGFAFSDNLGFHVTLPNRTSFSPDTGYHDLADSGMRFVEGAPRFAVEVRSENDYGPQVELAIAEKRRDYFAAGTRVVWDVDLVGADAVRKYLPDAPEQPVIYRFGDTADAEPALPGWMFPVKDLFE